MGMDLPVNQILQGDCRERLRELPDGCIHTVVTSPPFWGLRDYGLSPSLWLTEDLRDGPCPCEHDWAPESELVLHRKPYHGLSNAVDAAEARTNPSIASGSSQGRFCRKCGAWLGVYGLEPTPELYIEHTVQIFRQVRRVLRPDGTLWLNLGDRYASGRNEAHGPWIGRQPERPLGIKAKDLVGIPWMVAFALRADGWYLRQDIIWHKPNAMPESVRDRCTKAHDYVFLLSKSPRYYFDAEAIKEPVTGNAHARGDGVNPKAIPPCSGWDRSPGSHRVVAHNLGSKEQRRQRARIKQNESFSGSVRLLVTRRNKRSVWRIATHSFKSAHFATFPPELVRPCIRAATSEKGCCPTCGAPWHRIVQAVRVSASPDAIPDGRPQTPRQDADDTEGRCLVTQTIGWRPGCACDAGAPAPCVALDPFGGSGTVGMVAAQEGRDWLLIEAKSEYCEMAKQRTTGAHRQLSAVCG